MGRKIAVVTEDGQRISSHFGMAPVYKIFAVADGQVQSEEERPKPYHAQHPEHEHQLASHAAGHADMFAPLVDCQVLLCGGMGQPAYEKALAAGLEVVLAGGQIREVVAAYLHGQVTSDLRRIHRH